MQSALLDKIQAPGDIKKLPENELPALCDEIRDFLIQSVSATGGHLSSNLGVVELTVALHRVLDFPQDKLLFDVGHQCYTHKLLTGRRAGFADLRGKNGLSGFPNPQESCCDSFIAGHGSAALSTAIGIARAKKLKNEPGKVVVIIGDGAFTGGMVYEGMNNVSKLNNLIVILNDNKMSISKNVGQIANYLTRLRTDPKYFHAKAHMETVLERIPVAGDVMVKVLQGGKQMIRRGIYKQSTMFEEMGFQYVGPVDGHDIPMLTQMLTNLQEQYAPIFLHVVTQKGKGLKPAEDNPGEFHAVSSMDLSHLTDPELSPSDSFSSTFGQTLAALGDADDRMVAITAAMKYGTGLNFFKHSHPDRFFDVGMAEEHAVTFAGGLASQGLHPVVAIYSTFFQRAYDQIIHDVNLMHLNVLFAVDRAGLVPGDGETHQGIYDPAFFSGIGIPVYAPANYAELRYWLGVLARQNGPRAIRYPRGAQCPALAALGCSQKLFDVYPARGPARTTLVSYGAETEEILAARDTLAENGVQADVVKLVRLYPLPENLTDTLQKYTTVLFAEDTVRTGGIGQQLGFALQQAGWKGLYLLHAVDNSHLLHAKVPELRADQALDAESLARELLSVVKETPQ